MLKVRFINLKGATRDFYFFGLYLNCFAKTATYTLADIESGRLYRGTLHKYCIDMLIPTHASSYNTTH